MRLSSLALLAFATLSGCAAVRDPAVTAGATLGSDTRGFAPTMPLGGAFAGVRTRLVGLEGGVEAGRRINHVIHVTEGPSRERETAVQAYANATYTIDGGRRYRLYVLAGARFYRISTVLTDAAEYGIAPYDARWADHTVALNAGGGVGYGPVAIELTTPVPFINEAYSLNPGLALRARVSVPLLRRGEQ